MIVAGTKVTTVGTVSTYNIQADTSSVLQNGQSEFGGNLKVNHIVRALMFHVNKVPTIQLLPH